MKKLVALIALLALSLTLLAACGTDETVSGCYEADGSKYYFTPDGVAVLEGGEWSWCDYTVKNGVATVNGENITVDDLASVEVSAHSYTEEPFVTELVGGVKTAVGLTEYGKAQTVLFVPAGVGAIADNALSGGAVKALIITEASNSLNLDNGSLKNGGSLAVIIDADLAPGTALTCGASLLDGTSGVTFYIESEALSTYKTHYTWGNFKDLMEGI